MVINCSRSNTLREYSFQNIKVSFPLRAKTSQLFLVPEIKVIFFLLIEQALYSKLLECVCLLRTIGHRKCEYLLLTQREL